MTSMMEGRWGEDELVVAELPKVEERTVTYDVEYQSPGGEWHRAFGKRGTGAKTEAIGVQSDIKSTYGYETKLIEIVTTRREIS